MTDGDAGGALLEVAPVGAGSWPLVEEVFGGRGDPGRCWCQWFLQRNAEWQASDPDARRSAFEAEVAAVPGSGDGSPGLLARLDGRPVGWCRVGPRAGYARLTASTKSAASGGDLLDPSVWAVVCFVVAPAARGTGLTAMLLDSAVEHARAGGARVLEGYPVDVQARPRIGAAQLYHGSLSTFLAAGFVEVARTSAARPVVRLEL